MQQCCVASYRANFTRVTSSKKKKKKNSLMQVVKKSLIYSSQQRKSVIALQLATEYRCSTKMADFITVPLLFVRQKIFLVAVRAMGRQKVLSKSDIQSMFKS